jgi:hypothetical protein
LSVEVSSRSADEVLDQFSSGWKILSERRVERMVMEASHREGRREEEMEEVQ